MLSSQNGGGNKPGDKVGHDGNAQTDAGVDYPGAGLGHFFLVAAGGHPLNAGNNDEDEKDGADKTQKNLNNCADGGGDCSGKARLFFITGSYGGIINQAGVYLSLSRQ